MASLRSRLALLALAAAALAGTACSAPTDEDETGDTSEAQTDSQGWDIVGFGIGGKSVGSGSNILITYGGYTATDKDSRAWALAMASSPSFANLGVGHVFASRGPREAGYGSREMGNSKLAADLATRAANADYIIVAGHSSGAFVADELFTQVSPAVLSKIVYFALDGGSWALNNTRVSHMKGVYFVNAKDSAKGESHNASAMRSLHGSFPASRLFTVNATGSGCNSGATWCLHDTLITTRPHNPNMFDLADDYAQFSGARKVVTSFVDKAVSDGVIAPSNGGAPDEEPEPVVNPVASTSPSSAPPPAAPPAQTAQGASCSSDGDCNPGSDGAGMMCSAQHVCVAGCNASWECPGATTCVSGSCR